MEYRIVSSGHQDTDYLTRAILGWYQTEDKRTSMPSSPTLYKQTPYQSSYHNDISSIKRGKLAQIGISITSRVVENVLLGQQKNNQKIVIPNLTKDEKEFEIKPGIRLRKISSLGGARQDYFFWQKIDLLIINRASKHCQWKKLTGSKGINGREGAYLGTESFPIGTVGYGVHQSIGAIRFTLGDFGEAKIGELFNRPDVQELLALESTPANNQRVAKLEYEYWLAILADPNQSLKDSIGGFMGASFDPIERKNIQLGMGWSRQFGNYITHSIFDPSMLAIRDEVNRLKTFAQQRLDYLNSSYESYTSR